MEALLTETEAAILLKIRPRTLRYLRSKNQGPTYSQIGARVRYSQADLQRWVTLCKSVKRQQRATRSAGSAGRG